MYKELKQLNNNNKSKQWQKTQMNIFKEHKDGQQVCEKMLKNPDLSVKMQIKNNITSYLLEWQSSKSPQITGWKREPSYTIGRYISIKPLQETMEITEIKNYSTLSIYLKNTKTPI